MADSWNTTDVLSWMSDDTVTECCAKCRRGTRALQGPCGYHGNCPNGCHQRRNQ